MNSMTKSTFDANIRVRKTRSTLEERIKKHRALLAHARVLLQKAEEMQKEETVKKPPRHKQVWVPKAKPAPKTKVDGVAVQPSSDQDTVSPVPAPPTEPIIT